jgi:phage/plasmid-like protein (TIGR03299 family)
LDSKEATLETAGSLKNGRRVWVLAKINRPDSVIVAKSDDRVSKYVLLSNSHDGTIAVRVGFNDVRVVCQNTLSAAHASGSLIRIKHTGKVLENLENVRKIMDLADAKFEATAEQYRFLASKEINQKDLEKFVKIVFATKKQMAEETIEEMTSGKRVMSDIQRLFEHGRGNDMAGVKGTYWAAYNAIAEFVQYERGSDTAGRLNELWFGTGSSLNQKALVTAMAMVS